MDHRLTKDGLKYALARAGHQYAGVVLEMKKVELFVDSLDIKDLVLYYCMSIVHDLGNLCVAILANFSAFTDF